MKTTSFALEPLRCAFEHPAHGVVGLVDDLLRLCSEHELRLTLQANGVSVASLADDSEEVIDPPPGKSVLRAMLARVATLCNERAPNSVSPYGGKGELLAATDPPTIFRVTFKNTPSEQTLEILPAR
jgi:hypothetical protein